MLSKKINSSIAFFVAAVCFAMLFSSCSRDKNGLDWGKTKYYDDFLFFKYKPVIMERTVCFEYNEDAHDKGIQPTRFALYEKMDDESYKAVKPSQAKLYKNGTLCADNTFRTTLQDEEVKIGIEFTPETEEGTHKYCLKVIDNGGLNRINDIAAEEEPMPLLEEWRAKKDVVMNPLALGLTWFFIIVAVLLAVWICMLRFIFFPRISGGSIMVTEPYYVKISTSGKRRIVFASRKKEQSFLNRLFTGEIAYSVNAVWTVPLVLEHGSNRKIHVMSNKAYSIEPFTSNLERRTEYVIENVETHEKVKITVN